MKVLSFDNLLKVAAAGVVFGVLFAAVGVAFGLDVRLVAVVAAAGAGVFSAFLLKGGDRASG